MSRDFPTADVFTFHHGAVMYDFEICLKLVSWKMMLNNFQVLNRPLSSEIEKVMLEIAIDTGALVWLHAIHGVDPLTMQFTQWETDIHEVTRKTIDEQIF